VIETRTVHFDIESAQRAFDSLAPLALGATRRELLETAKLDAYGELHEVTLPWLEPRGNKVSHPETVLMGYIHIHDQELTVEVNSAQRAKAFRLLISNTPAAMARYRKTRRQSPEKRLQSPSSDPDLRATRH
jgi:hypothetical protein